MSTFLFVSFHKVFISILLAKKEMRYISKRTSVIVNFEEKNQINQLDENLYSNHGWTRLALY